MMFVCVFLTLSLNAQTPKTSTLPTDLLDLPAPPSVIPVKAKAAEETRPEDFYDEKNIPPDDAPIEDLLDYWKQKSEQFDKFRYNLKPSKETLERILNELREKPELVADYIKILPAEPEVIALVKNAYEKGSEGERQNYGKQENLRIWLRNNSDTFINELSQSVEMIRMNDRILNNQEDLEALARVDWNRAKPIVDRFEANRASIETYTLAKFVLYHHALKEKNNSDAESYRNELKKLVEDKSLSHKARDLAMDALVLGGDFEGRTEWYISLLNDETLLELQDNGFTGLTTLPRFMPTKHEQWLSSMTRLVETGTPSERSAAIRNLLLIRGKADKEVLKILLPWLTDKNWARESDDDEREQYIAALGTAEMPEAIPGLISIIANEEGEIGAVAAHSIGSYDAPQAIPALRNALVRDEGGYREAFIEALIKLNGFSIEEQVAGLEAFSAYVAKAEASEDTYAEVEEAYQVVIGRVLSLRPEPEDMLVTRCIERLKVLQRTNPPVAAQFSLILQRWKNRLIDIEMLNLAKSGKADVAVILKLLARREDLRKRVPMELSAMKMIDGLPRGLSAVMSEDHNEVFNILKRGGTDTQISTLAAARLVRLKIPVGDVAPFLSNSNKSLALAAERYLETEDSLEARNLILAKYPNEARILGARRMFTPVENKNFQPLMEPLTNLFRSTYDNRFSLPNESTLIEIEKNLRDEIKQKPDLQAVFALLENGQERRAVVRLFKDKIVFTQYEDQTRYYDRELSPKEYEAFYRFLIDSKIDTHQYTSDWCFTCTNGGEFLMFGRNGGRRVFTQRSYSTAFPAMEKLFEFFDTFAKGDLKLHYKLSEKIDGLEVLLADNKFVARSMWKNGADFRVLVEDNEKKKAIEAELENLDIADAADISIAQDEKYMRRAQRRQESLFKHFSWRKIENNKLSGFETEQPDAVKYLENSSFKEDYYDSTAAEPKKFSQRANGYEFRTESRYGGNLIKVTASGSQTVIKQGNYEDPVVSPDGKWLLAEKSVEEDKPKKLVRINLQNGSEFVITGIPAADIIVPITFVNSQHKFLIVRAKIHYLKNKDNPSPKTPEHYLLDPDTGTAQLVKGEFSPLFHQTYRGLQPTANPSEFWVAMPVADNKHTEIGRYNEKTATFKSVLQLPDISLDSMKIWVDEPASKVYFIYNGHLLSVPLPK